MADKLFTECIIEFDDKQRIYAEVTDRDKARRLIDILLEKEGAYEPLLKEINSSRPDLVKNLTETDIEEELKKGKSNTQKKE